MKQACAASLSPQFRVFTRCSSKTDVDSLPWVGYVDDFNCSQPQASQEKACAAGESFAFEANDAGLVYQAVRAGLGKGLIPDVRGQSDPALPRISGKEPEMVRGLRVLVHQD